MTAVENQSSPMTQKTAMQQLIDSIKEKYDSLPQEGKNFADRFILVEAPQLLAIERQQLIDAYCEPYNYENHLPPDLIDSAEQYYEQTFGNFPSPQTQTE